jgi:hypothetical protein
MMLCQALFLHKIFFFLTDLGKNILRARKTLSGKTPELPVRAATVTRRVTVTISGRYQRAFGPTLLRRALHN